MMAPFLFMMQVHGSNLGILSLQVAASTRLPFLLPVRHLLSAGVDHSHIPQLKEVYSWLRARRDRGSIASPSVAGVLMHLCLLGVENGCFVAVQTDLCMAGHSL